MKNDKGKNKLRRSIVKWMERKLYIFLRLQGEMSAVERSEKVAATDDEHCVRECVMDWCAFCLLFFAAHCHT